MPNALETPWVTLEVNDVPLSLCDDLGRPNHGMISWSVFCFFFFPFFSHLLSLLSPDGKAFTPSCEWIGQRLFDNPSQGFVQWSKVPKQE